MPAQSARLACGDCRARALVESKHVESDMPPSLQLSLAASDARAWRRGGRRAAHSHERRQAPERWSRARVTGRRSQDARELPIQTPAACARARMAPSAPLADGPPSTPSRHRCRHKTGDHIGNTIRHASGTGDANGIDSDDDTDNTNDLDNHDENAIGDKAHDNANEKNHCGNDKNDHGNAEHNAESTTEPITMPTQTRPPGLLTS